MTRLDTFSQMFDLLERNAIGFNRILPTIVSNEKTTYPYSNLVKLKENEYLLEIALAGYSKEDISISQSTNMLVIEGEKEEEKREYLWNGIASRKFRKEFPLANDVEVLEAGMKDGVLSILLGFKHSDQKQITIQ